MSSITTLRRPQRQRIAAWLVLTAMVFQAAWPALANAQRPDSTVPFEVCTAQGVRADAGIPNGSGGHGPGAQLLSGHCALCATGTDDLPVVHQADLKVPTAVISDTEKRRTDRFSLRVPALRLFAHPRDPPIES